jgi:hypothetical protein
MSDYILWRYRPGERYNYLSENKPIRRLKGKSGIQFFAFGAIQILFHFVPKLLYEAVGQLRHKNAFQSQLWNEQLIYDKLL